MSDDTRIRPFSNGTEFAMYTERNCLRCTKQWNPDTPTVFSCAIEQALSDGYIGDGTIPKAINDRMGESKDSSWGHALDCPERELAPEFWQRV